LAVSGKKRAREKKGSGKGNQSAKAFVRFEKGEEASDGGKEMSRCREYIAEDLRGWYEKD